MHHGPQVWCSRNVSPGCTSAPWSARVVLQKAFPHMGCRIGLQIGNGETQPFCGFTVSPVTGKVDTHKSMCFTVSL